jgi:hypothetical protein
MNFNEIKEIINNEESFIYKIKNNMKINGDFRLVLPIKNSPDENSYGVNISIDKPSVSPYCIVLDSMKLSVCKLNNVMHKFNSDELRDLFGNNIIDDNLVFDIYVIRDSDILVYLNNIM